MSSLNKIIFIFSTSERRSACAMSLPTCGVPESRGSHLTDFYLGRVTNKFWTQLACVSLSYYADFVTHKKIKNICGQVNSPSLCSFAKPDKLKQHYVFDEIWIRDLVNPRFFPLKHVCLFPDKRIADWVTLLHQLPFSPSPAPRHR